VRIAHHCYYAAALCCMRGTHPPVGGTHPSHAALEGEGGRVLHGLERFNRRLSDVLEWIGLAAMLLVMLITCVDVIGAKVFLWRLLGAIDMVMLSQIVATAFAAGTTLFLRRHIEVELVHQLLPRRVRAAIESLVSLIGLGFFVVIVWQLCVLGHNFYVSGEYSATARIPYYPFAYGIAVGCVPVCLILLLDFFKSLGRIVQR
jgi:TRAP-type C4-dicarboxylate transport system permease small subunit